MILSVCLIVEISGIYDHGIPKIYKPFELKCFEFLLFRQNLISETVSLIRLTCVIDSSF